MLVKIAGKIIYAAGGIIGRFFMALRLTPNAITGIGLVFTVFIGVLFGLGYIGTAGVMLIASCLLDSVDGLVARKTGRVTKFGGFFDSSLDRYADMALYGGLLVFTVRDYPNNARWFTAPVIVIVLAAAGAFIVSYTKARGDGVAGEIRQGYWGRVERLIMLIIGTGIGRAGTALWVLAILPQLTVIHRMLIVKARLVLTGQENPEPGKVKESRRLWWARMSDDGTKIIFPWYLRILFQDYKRGSIPYDIACAVFILTDIFLPLEWIVSLNTLVAKYLG